VLIVAIISRHRVVIVVVDVWAGQWILAI
jgi:hypothetical protein